MIISDTGPLIYLSKIGKLNLLKKLFNSIIIPGQVFEEVMAKKDTYSESNYVKKAINDNWIRIENIELTDNEIKDYLGLGFGEKAVISLSKNLRPELLLIDDPSAWIIAESLGFKVKGTLYVLLEAFRKSLLTKKEAKELVNKLISSGFWISQDIYIKFLEELEKA